MTTIADPRTASLCQGSPVLSVVDNRGLPVRTVQYNRASNEEAFDELISQQSNTELGQLFSRIDPRLLSARQLDPAVPPNFRYDQSLSGQGIRSVSQDAGEQVVIYDVEGGPVWKRDSRGLIAEMEYDTLHRLITVTEQDDLGVAVTSERIIYGEAVEAPAAANLRGQIALRYDTAGMTRTPSCAVTGETLRSEQQFLLESIVNSNWAGTDASAWQRDLDPAVYISSWAYNALGSVVQSTDARGNQQAMQINVAGQLASSSLRLAGQASAHDLLSAISYSAAGQPLREVAGNGVVTEYGYEAATQRLSTFKTSRPAQSGRTSVLQDLQYSYDPVGNILAINDAAMPPSYTRNQKVEGENRYSYDALYQLLSATGRENANAGQQTATMPLPIVPLAGEAGQLSNYTRYYSYDRGGNLIGMQQVGQNSYTRSMVVAPTSNRAVQQTGGVMPGDVDGEFDACGNLRQLAPGQPLVWNTRNQLQRTVQVVRGGPDDDCENYRYDTAGQRATKVQTSLTSGTTRTARVLYLPGLELRRTEQNQGGSATPVEVLQVIKGGAAGRQSVRCLHWEVGQPAAIENDQLRFSLGDQIGSLLLELDQQADILTWEEYYPYGGTAVWSARNETETKYKYVRYSGKERDGSGLYYYGFRYYAPWLFRWISPDPAGTVDGLNLFCMVGNNPIAFSDFAGLNRESSLVGEADLDGQGASASGAAQSRGPAYFKGSSQKNTGLAAPTWQYDKHRPAGDQVWHSVRQKSSRILGKHQYVFGADRAITGSELETLDNNQFGPSYAPQSIGGTPNIGPGPLEILKRRKSFSQRPINILSGSHGNWHGNNWDGKLRYQPYLEQDFLEEDLTSYAGSQWVTASHVQNPMMEFIHTKNRVVPELGTMQNVTFHQLPGKRTGFGYYANDNYPKGSFNSRLRFYNMKGMTDTEFNTLTSNKGEHAILAYCFGRNDEALRHYRSLQPVVSYIGPDENTGLYNPPLFKDSVPDNDPQAPTKNNYKAHHLP
ncbi:RHS repeat-associated core domain-containing protein [Pseudoduganella violacea]|uniref:RHS repeat-associated protein n=1 Tax=Pseudoduganella violacea TaxID=1715466 RepID=A0A7W5FWE2_9BURK|nr:RHS repeat-associated core domain-containing protein [Pseudoduganella violacea]MBB3121746.1 RHS repeat-associated protein [Pseudoduganella violacea]